MLIFIEQSISKYMHVCVYIFKTAKLMHIRMYKHNEILHQGSEPFW